MSTSIYVKLSQYNALKRDFFQLSDKFKKYSYNRSIN